MQFKLKELTQHNELLSETNTYSEKQLSEPTVEILSTHKGELGLRGTALQANQNNTVGRVMYERGQHLQPDQGGLFPSVFDYLCYCLDHVKFTQTQWYSVLQKLIPNILIHLFLSSASLSSSISLLQMSVQQIKYVGRTMKLFSCKKEEIISFSSY